ncbi:MAG: hypothetical protein R2909_19400 [Gemmatimonadales bacterium]
MSIVWMGLYPKPVLDKMEPAAIHYLQTVKPGEPVPGAAVAGGGATP